MREFSVILLAATLFVGFATPTQAQEAVTTTETSTKITAETDSKPEKSFDTFRTEFFDYATLSNIWKTTEEKKNRYNGNWGGINIGFANTTLSGSDADFSWSGSTVFAWNFFETDVPFNKRKTTGLTLGLGLEYQRFRFANDHLSFVNEGGITSTYSLDSDMDIRRSVFKNLYLTVPAIVGVTVGKFNIGAGLIGGVRLHTKTKVVYDLDGDKRKLKDTNNYNMLPVKVDATLRLRYGSVSIYANYTLTDAFESGKGPQFAPFTVGIGFGD